MAAIFLGALWLLLCVWYCPPSAVETVRQCLDESVIEEEYQSLGATLSPQKEQNKQDEKIKDDF
jgi:hypothetical protein